MRNLYLPILLLLCTNIVIDIYQNKQNSTNLHLSVQSSQGLLVAIRMYLDFRLHVPGIFHILETLLMIDNLYK